MGLCPPFLPWAQCFSQYGTVHWPRVWTQQCLTSPDQASFALMAYGAATPCVTLSVTDRTDGRKGHTPVSGPEPCVQGVSLLARWCTRPSQDALSTEHFNSLYLNLQRFTKMRVAPTWALLWQALGNSTCSLRRLTVAWRTFLLQVFCFKLVFYGFPFKKK